MKLKFSLLLVIGVLAMGLTGCIPVNIEPLPIDTEDVTQLKYTNSCGFCDGDYGLQTVDVSIERDAKVITAQASVAYSSGDPLICPAKTLNGDDYTDFVVALKLLKVKIYSTDDAVMMDGPTTVLSLISRNGSAFTRKISDSNGLTEDSFANYERLLSLIQRLQDGCGGKREPMTDSEIGAVVYEIKPQGLALAESQFSARVYLGRKSDRENFNVDVRVKRGLTAAKTCRSMLSGAESSDLLRSIAPIELATAESVLACGEPSVLTLIPLKGQPRSAEVEMTSSGSRKVFVNTAELSRIVQALADDCH